jgi:hypothetical protein
MPFRRDTAIMTSPPVDRYKTPDLSIPPLIEINIPKKMRWLEVPVEA